MNIVKLQDSLKELSDSQLGAAIQQGTVPAYLIIAEMERRKRMRQESAAPNAAPQSTVAQDVVAAMPPAMPSEQDMSGVAALPIEAGAEGFAEGGIVSFAGGGSTKPNYTGLVDIMKGMGIEDTSKEARRQIYEQVFGGKYTGASEQNEQLRQYALGNVVPVPAPAFTRSPSKTPAPAPAPAPAPSQLKIPAPAASQLKIPTPAPVPALAPAPAPTTSQLSPAPARAPAPALAPAAIPSKTPAPARAPAFTPIPLTPAPAPAQKGIAALTDPSGPTQSQIDAYKRLQQLAAQERNTATRQGFEATLRQMGTQYPGIAGRTGNPAMAEPTPPSRPAPKEAPKEASLTLSTAVRMGKQKEDALRGAAADVRALRDAAPTQEEWTKYDNQLRALQSSGMQAQPEAARALLQQTVRPTLDAIGGVFGLAPSSLPSAALLPPGVQLPPIIAQPSAATATRPGAKGTASDLTKAPTPTPATAAAPAGVNYPELPRYVDTEAQKVLAEMREAKGKKEASNLDHAMIAAGLSMMAGTSPYAFENIGKGGIAGLNQYFTGKKDIDDLHKDMQKLQVGMEKDRNKYDIDAYTAKANKWSAMSELDYNYAKLNAEKEMNAARIAAQLEATRIAASGGAGGAGWLRTVLNNVDDNISTLSNQYARSPEAEAELQRLLQQRVHIQQMMGLPSAPAPTAYPPGAVKLKPGN